jgi:hypothetical protein
MNNNDKYKQVGVSIAFTGTRTGLSSKQRISLITTITQLKPRRVTHGGCIGADKEFHDICKLLNIPTYIHPCNIKSKRAECLGAIFVFSPLPPLERNKIIVDESELLIATPKTKNEILRSGTWSTIRYARKIGKRVIIIYPDGCINCNYTIIVRQTAQY